MLNMACKSQIEPLQLKFSNVTLTNDGQANRMGLALQFGSPGQIIALTPSTLVNNTVLTNRASCGSNANSSCIQSIGGGFDPSASSDFHSSVPAAWNGSAESGADVLINIPSIYFNDVLTVALDQTTQALPGFPLLLGPTQTSVYSQLGLGSNSTFINRLIEARLAPSRSWSFFAGIYSRLQAGSLIVGGYADRFYQGTLYTKNVTDTCTTCFELVSMDYYQDGVTTSLLPDGSSGSMNILVEPYYPVMLVPNDMFYKFGNATNGTLTSVFGLHSYSPNAVPTGNITITLSNGLTTTIPNKALFDPPAYDNGILDGIRIGSTVYGVFSPWSSWTSTPMIPNTAVLGMPYAAMVYLIRDYERQSLSIANANQEAEIGGNAESICPLNETSHRKVNHTGDIVGGVIGGLVGLFLITLLAWFLWRRGRRPGTKLQGLSEASVDSEKSEMRSDSRYPQEKSSLEKSAGTPNNPSEMPNDTAKIEMPSKQSTHPTEMPAEGNVVRSELPS